MIVWVLLFFAVVLVSLILAGRSLRSYRENPSYLLSSYSLYLVQKPDLVTPELLNLLHSLALKERLIISFERLFKGERSALVVYLPSELTLSLKHLSLLELEDYSYQPGEGLVVYEVGPKYNLRVDLSKFSLVGENLGLKEKDQLWWQIVLQPVLLNDQPIFQVVFRAVVTSTERERAGIISANLLNQISEANLTRLPKSIVSGLLKQFQSRAMLGIFSDGKGAAKITSEEIIKMLRS